MGFGAEIGSAAEQDLGLLFQQVQQQDLLKFGIIPELIGRLPVVATLDSLSREDLVRILTEPKNAMTKQYQALMKMDGVELIFEPAALEAVADRAIERKIGARGLRSIMEAVMTEVMYTVPSDTGVLRVVIDEDSVREGGSPKVFRTQDLAG